MFVRDNPRGQTVLAVSLAAAIILPVAVALRLLSRWKSRAGFGADDIWITLSLIPTYAMLISGGFSSYGRSECLHGSLTLSCIVVFDGGLGKHSDTLSQAQMILLMKVKISGTNVWLKCWISAYRLSQTMYTTLITYSTTIAAVRISVLLLYRRIFRTRPFKLAVYVVGVLTVAWWLAAVLVELFQCRPVKAAWDIRLKPTSYCVNFQAYYYGIAATNLTLDCVTLAMPLSMVWRLQMATRQKVLLSGVFLLGGL